MTVCSHVDFGESVKIQNTPQIKDTKMRGSREELRESSRVEKEQVKMKLHSFWSSRHFVKIVLRYVNTYKFTLELFSLSLVFQPEP